MTLGERRCSELRHSISHESTVCSGVHEPRPILCGPNCEVSLGSKRTPLAGCADGGPRANHVTECPCTGNRPIWYTDFAGRKPGPPDDPGRTTETSTRAA